MARETPSMSAFTKFSVTVSERARAEVAWAQLSGAGSSDARHTLAATAAGSRRCGRWSGREDFIVIRSK